jgi:AraC family transcriptional regulator
MPTDVLTDADMALVLKTTPLRMTSDPPSGAIAYWEHGALHDVVEAYG